VALTKLTVGSLSRGADETDDEMSSEVDHIRVEETTTSPMLKARAVAMAAPLPALSGSGHWVGTTMAPARAATLTVASVETSSATTISSTRCARSTSSVRMMATMRPTVPLRPGRAGLTEATAPSLVPAKGCASKSLWW